MLDDWEVDVEIGRGMEMGRDGMICSRLSGGDATFFTLPFALGAYLDIQLCLRRPVVGLDMDEYG